MRRGYRERKELSTKAACKCGYCSLAGEANDTLRTIRLKSPSEACHGVLFPLWNFTILLWNFSSFFISSFQARRQPQSLHPGQSRHGPRGQDGGLCVEVAAQAARGVTRRRRVVSNQRHHRRRAELRPSRADRHSSERPLARRKCMPTPTAPPAAAITTPSIPTAMSRPAAGGPPADSSWPMRREEARNCRSTRRCASSAGNCESLFVTH